MLCVHLNVRWVTLVPHNWPLSLVFPERTVLLMSDVAWRGKSSGGMKCALGKLSWGLSWQKSLSIRCKYVGCFHCFCFVLFWFGFLFLFWFGLFLFLDNFERTARETAAATPRKCCEPDCGQ